MDEETLTRVIGKVLDDRNRIDATKHAQHHAFIEAFIEEVKIKKQRVERVKTHVLGWGLVAAISGALMIGWEWLRTTLGK